MQIMQEQSRACVCNRKQQIVLYLTNTGSFNQKKMAGETSDQTERVNVSQQQSLGHLRSDQNQQKVPQITA